MIRTLRAFFLSRLLREKLLLVAFLGIGVLIWASGFSTRASLFSRVVKTTTMELKDQDHWLANRKNVEASAQKAAAQLDPAKTLDGTRLFTTVRQLAIDAGLRNPRNEGLTQEGGNGQFVNTLSISVQAFDPDAKKNWEALKAFYLALHQRSPYIAINQFTLQPNRANPGQLTLALKVKAVEISH